MDDDPQPGTVAGGGPIIVTQDHVEQNLLLCQVAGPQPVWIRGIERRDKTVAARQQKVTFFSAVVAAIRTDVVLPLSDVWVRV